MAEERNYPSESDRYTDGAVPDVHQLLAPTAAASDALERLRNGVRDTEAKRPRWAQNWTEAALPLLRAASLRRQWGLLGPAALVAAVGLMLGAASLGQQ